MHKIKVNKILKYMPRYKFLAYNKGINKTNHLSNSCFPVPYTRTVLIEESVS